MGTVVPRRAGRAPEHRSGAGARPGPAPGGAGDGRRRVRRADRRRLVAGAGHPHRRADALPDHRLGARLVRVWASPTIRGCTLTIRTCTRHICSPGTAAGRRGCVRPRPRDIDLRPRDPTQFRTNGRAMTASGQALHRRRLGGAARPRHAPVENPATEQIIGTVPAGTAADVDRGRRRRPGRVRRLGGHADDRARRHPGPAACGADRPCRGDRPNGRAGARHAAEDRQGGPGRTAAHGA